MQSNNQKYRDKQVELHQKIATDLANATNDYLQNLSSGLMKSLSYVPNMEDILAFLMSLPSNYALEVIPDQVPIHIDCLRELQTKKQNVALRCVMDADDRIWATVVAPDQAHLLQTIIGCFANVSVNIAEAHIFRTKDAIALDFFLIEYDTSRMSIAALTTMLFKTLSEELLSLKQYDIHAGANRTPPNEPGTLTANASSNSLASSASTSSYKSVSSLTQKLADFNFAGPATTSGEDNSNSNNSSNNNSNSNNNHGRSGSGNSNKKARKVSISADQDQDINDDNSNNNNNGVGNESTGNSSNNSDNRILARQRLWTHEDIVLPPHQVISPTQVEIVAEAGSKAIIGQGSGGYLRKCTLKDRPGNFALKTVSKEQIRDRHVCSEFFNEIRVLSQLDHPHCVQFIGGCVKPPNLFMITEYLGGGTLYDMIHQAPNRLNKIGIYKVARDLAGAMLYLHQQNLIHRDLKSSNIMFPENSGEVKIIDFGLSRGVAGTMTGETGSYRWMAPEVIRHCPYSEKCDVYSYGVVLYELVSKEIPFRELSPVQAALAATEGQKTKISTSCCKSEVANLIRACWDADPQKRPSFAQIHGFMVDQAQQESLASANQQKSASKLFSLFG